MKFKKQIIKNIISGIILAALIILCLWATDIVMRKAIHSIIGTDIKNVAINNYSYASYALVVLAIIEITYFIFALAKAYRQADQKDKELAHTVYMYDIQETLFDAYKNPEYINTALNKVAEMLGAETAFLVSIDGGYVKKVYYCGEEKPEWAYLLSRLNVSKWNTATKNKLSKGNSVVYYFGSDLDNHIIKKYNINSMMLVPVLDSDSKLVSILGCTNMDKKWENAEVLECVSRNFYMALKNIESYNIICEMGTIDTLTGLKNRNSYQHDLVDYSYNNNDSMCCIYIDANGLHEINNHLGHEMGDEMLRFIGSTLKSVFGVKNSYRVGGDEFVVFCINCDKDEVEKNIDFLLQRVEEARYDVSIGAAWLGENTDNIEKLAAEAESKMYDAKHLYYEKKGNVSKARELNLRLEKILVEKKDADNFLSIISTYFMGVYMVNLDSDDTRVIYEPSHFADILNEMNNKFKPSIIKYINTYVHTEDRSAFIEFLNYEFIGQELMENRVPEFHYRKPDGTNIMLHIYKSKEYKAGTRESYWLFEEYN